MAMAIFSGLDVGSPKAYINRVLDLCSYSNLDLGRAIDLGPWAGNRPWTVSAKVQLI